MNGIESPELSPELSFLSECLVAVSQDEYRNALRIVSAGLAKQLRTDTELDAKDLISGLFVVVNCLESHLTETGGEQTEVTDEKESEVKNNDIELLRCSFCGKEPKEVQSMIAGPRVYICDGCVQICNDILQSNSAAG